MFNSNKKVTIEWISEEKETGFIFKKKPAISMSNPIADNSTSSEKLSQMVSKILEEELPQLKNNSLLYNLVLFTLIEKMKTVQTVENVLSYIKGNNAKMVKDISFKNGEVRIKCST